MPHFLFHVADGTETYTTDEDLADVNEVRLEAVYDAREMLVEGLMAGEDRSDWRLAVTDEEGRTVVEVPFSQAFQTD
jgi:hypothetical protein